MSGLLIEVVGTPAPQGSKSAFRNPHTGRINQVESSKKVAPWRQDVRTAATDAANDTGWEKVVDAPVAVHITFRFNRPSSHYGSGKNRHKVKDSAAHAPCTRSSYDIDKLARSTLDALTQAGVFHDDAQVAELVTVKAYCEQDELPGATILIQPLIPADIPSIEDVVVQGSLL